MQNNQSITIHQSLSPELQFLIACCQTEPSENDINFIRSFLNPPSESDNTNTIHYSLFTIHSAQKLIALARQHGILPLVYKTLKNLSESIASSSSRNTYHVARSTLLSELKPLYMSIVQRNMLMTSELLRIMKLLEENSIEALAFKGPALSQMAYGDITLRQYVDLDVLVKKEDIYKIDALLKDRGYQRVLEMTPTQEEVYMTECTRSGSLSSQKWRTF